MLLRWILERSKEHYSELLSFYNKPVSPSSATCRRSSWKKKAFHGTPIKIDRAVVYLLLGQTHFFHLD